jgi:hypothetical protein
VVGELQRRSGTGAQVGRFRGLVRLPPGWWFEVCVADTLDECWRQLLDWRPPAGQRFDERKVQRPG